MLILYNKVGEKYQAVTIVQHTYVQIWKIMIYL